MPKAVKSTTRKKATKRSKATGTRKRSTGRRAPEAAAASGPMLKVRQVKSGIGHARTYRRTLRALGLKHHQDEVVVRDDRSMQGMLVKVRHLVAVTPMPMET